MTVHFTLEEFSNRKSQVVKELKKQKLDGLLMFRQESMYWLTGYDTFGYVYFQCLILTAKGDLVLLTRAPDLRQAQNTSIIKDIQLNNSLKNFTALHDKSELVSYLRVIKSDAEIIFVKKAAELADCAMEVAWKYAHAGQGEAKILAEMQGVIFEGGGDYPANEFIIGSGKNALLCRYQSEKRKLSDVDQLSLEWAGTYKHYHSCLFRTILIGKANDKQKKMHAACIKALSLCEKKLKSGNKAGDVFDAHAEIFDSLGYKESRMNACGYSLGSTFSPNWMDWPMLYNGNPITLAPGMVFFMHMILMDSENQLAMNLGETYLITEKGNERLGKKKLDLVIC